MTIQYPNANDNNVDSWFKCALSHPTFLEGLNWLMTMEHERAKKAFIRNDSHDTMFSYFIREFTRKWHDVDKAIDLLHEIKFPKS